MHHCLPVKTIRTTTTRKFRQFQQKTDSFLPLKKINTKKSPRKRHTYKVTQIARFQGLQQKHDILQPTVAEELA